MKKYQLYLSACAAAVALAACGGGNDAAEDKATAAPVITTQPAAVSAILNTAATFKVAATGGGLNYKWYKVAGTAPDTAKDLAVAGVSAAEFTFNTTLESYAGDYYVVVSNTLNGTPNSVTSATARLTVNIPATVTTYPAALTVTAGSSATFSVVATGTGTLKYQWYVYKLNEAGTTAATTPTTIDGATAATYTIASAKKNPDATTYFVTVTNEYGVVTTPAVKLTVN